MSSISFKKFIQAIHTAILLSSEQIIERNVSLLDKYFEEKEVEEKNAEGQTTVKKTLVPKTVTLIYPQKKQEVDHENSNDYAVIMEPVEVPLISMVPLEMCGIKKATFTTEFQMEVINDEIQIYFGKPTSPVFQKTPRTNLGKLEITLSPQDTTEGLKIISEGYENLLKRQIT